MPLVGVMHVNLPEFFASVRTKYVTLKNRQKSS
jgi:hypothetical protein